MSALDKMPKERRTDFVAGKLAPSSVGRRTFTRVDGNKFQISKTAGLGSDACCSGVVISENGKTIIDLRTTFGIFPHAAYVGLALALFAVSIGFFAYGEYVISGVSLVGAVTAIGYRALRLYDAKFLRNELKRQISGIEWKRVSN